MANLANINPNDVSDVKVKAAYAAMQSIHKFLIEWMHANHFDPEKVLDIKKALF